MTHTPRVIYYFQTPADLGPVLTNPALTHIHVAAYHFGHDADGTPYIHLNNHPPEEFPSWGDLNLASHAGKRVVAMVGGAGGGFAALFADYETFYPLLRQEVLTRYCLSGVDLDVEEEVSLVNIRRLMGDLKRDLPPKYLLTMAPAAASLASDEPGIGGFVYADLAKTPEGQAVDYYNAQCYGVSAFTPETYAAILGNGWPPSKVNMGMLAPVDMGAVCGVLSAVAAKTPFLGGAFIWEYFEAPVGWVDAVHTAMVHHTWWVSALISDILSAVYHHLWSS